MKGFFSGVVVALIGFGLYAKWYTSSGQAALDALKDMKFQQPGANQQSKNNFLRPESNSQDDVLSRQLIGSWEFSESQMDLTFSGIETYFPDGTSTMAATLKTGGKKSAVSVSSTWKIEGSKIKERITQSSIPDIHPIGKTMTDDIVKLTDDEFVTRDSEGGIFSRRRVSK